MNSQEASWRWAVRNLISTTICAVATTAVAAQTAASEYLSDEPELILSTTQAWGEPGWNVAAHAAGQAGLPLQIGGKSYAKGIGHHANGSIPVLLDGEYASFDAEVGLQPCGGDGSVIFRVFVDDEKRFDSGIMQTTSAPKPIHLDLAGAQVLRLEANDAGDGILCDMANWADARLTRASVTAPHMEVNQPVDIARFARVVAWNPNRLDGARANRIEEFRGEDLFLETDLSPNADSTYTAPVSTNGLACIGLQWLNRRALRELVVEFARASPVPATNTVQVQGWFGESAWQGNWKPLAGQITASGNRLSFRLSPKAGIVQTQKIRWVFPANERPVVRSLLAYTRSHWQTVNLLVVAEKPGKRARGEFRVHNGEIVDVGSGDRSRLAPAAVSSAFDLSRPLRLSIRCSRLSSFKTDPTVLQFRLPSGSFGVAIQDVLSNDCVYLPDHGLFITRDPAPVTFADYKRKIAGRKTILQQVRERPDQTLEEAMAKTHHDAQREGPVMLSLACDNSKFVVERNGTVRFQTTTNLAKDWFATAGEMRPQFGSTQPGQLTRSLDGGWLPIPVITMENGGLLYRQRTFVAPCDEDGSNPARLNRLSVCVAEFTVTNTLTEPVEAAVLLNFLADSRQKEAASLTRCASGFLVANEAGPFALIAIGTDTALKVSAKAGELKFNDMLPPHASVSFAVLLPADRSPIPAHPDIARLRAETEAYWNAVLVPAMQVETPDPLLNNVIRSSQVRCLIAARNEAGGARIAPWIAAMSYGPLESEAHSVIRGMDFMGHEEFARRGLDFFINRYNTNGFLTTGYTTFGTAWDLWTLGEHYQLYRDTNWLRRVAPEVARAGGWIVRQTEKTAGAGGAPEHGLMPPGVMADWNSFAYHFAMNAYYYAALRGLGTALSDLAAPPGSLHKTPDDDLALRTSHLALAHAAELRTNILRAYRWTQSQSPALPLRNGTWIPHYPSQVHSPGKLADFFPGQDAGRSWCYDVEIGAHQLVPTGVFDPQDREVERMLDHMEDVQFLSDGWFDYPAELNEKDWFNLGGFSKVQPYYTRNCEVYALRDDVRPFVRSYFNTIAAMLNPEVLTFWEHFHHSGAWDKTHETGYFLHQTRTMLVTERGDQLWLAPFITSNWLKNGMVVAVTNAPTRFGPVSYRIISHVSDGYIEASIEPPQCILPKAVVLRLRNPDGNPLRSVTVNGRRNRQFDTATQCILIKPSAASLKVTAKY
jgi:hypothetical protein